MSVKSIFRPVILISNSVNVFINRRVLVPPASVTTSLITVNNIYKRIFI
jgi:hypothetical protein